LTFRGLITVLPKTLYISAFALLFAGFTIACDEPAAERCGGVEINTSCQPLYEPTFANIHRQTLLTRCAVGGGACHLAAGRRGGLSLEDADEAFHGLVTEGRVVAGDPSCSQLSHRMIGVSGDLMPPGAPLGEMERCAIDQWIENGAVR
jgi:hypothetical protein